MTDSKLQPLLDAATKALATLAIIAVWVLCFPGCYWVMQVWLPKHISWLSHDEAFAGAMGIGGLFCAYLFIGILIEIWTGKLL